ncbi:MAG TPA: PstS family phosphate ABC transporter substrate-binding protein [Steroidobacteraceae bacterium]|nr:PstS family phosphate ABC transporter substrate-binding protein [Steroidobacteraceae bacterium]
MPTRLSARASRLHPTRHLFYAFLIGAVLTSIGFLLAWLDRDETTRSPNRVTLLVAGSETLRPLMSSCAEAFVSRQRKVEVIVRGGGSATGIAALLAGQIDVALSSRELTDAEIQHARSIGFQLKVKPIAREAIAIIAHRDVTLDQLQVDQLAALLDGSVANWSVLGVPGEPVTIVGRSAGSGTASVIEERVLKGRRLAPSARLLDTHEGVIETVAATPGALGYADARMAQANPTGLRIIALSIESAVAASLPELDAIAAGRYPLARKLFVISSASPAPALDSFLTYCNGDAAESLIEAAGFIPVGSVLIGQASDTAALQ